MTDTLFGIIRLTTCQSHVRVLRPDRKKAYLLGASGTDRAGSCYALCHALSRKSTTELPESFLRIWAYCGKLLESDIEERRG